MKICAISLKRCWQNELGEWCSTGGFPLQMSAISTLFDEMSIIVVNSIPQAGGIKLPGNCKVIPLHEPWGKDFSRKLSILANIYYYLKAITNTVQQADVIHTPLPGDIPLLGLFVALFLRKYIIVRFGGSWHSNNQTTISTRITKFVLKVIAGGKNVVLLTGEKNEKPIHNMEWIYTTAISTEELQSIHASNDRGLSNPPRLIYAGRLSPEKGVINLLQAIAILKKENFQPLPHLVIAGDGPLRTDFEQFIIDNNCEEIVKFTGQLDRHSLSVQFEQADICIQPSLTEGLSKAWLDAFSHGIPVISSDVGAASFVIGRHNERGWLIPPGEVDAILDQIKFVLSQEINWKLLHESCVTFVQNRTLENWAQQIGEICSRQWKLPFNKGKIDNK